MRDIIERLDQRIQAAKERERKSKRLRDNLSPDDGQLAKTLAQLYADACEIRLIELQTTLVELKTLAAREEYRLATAAN